MGCSASSLAEQLGINRQSLNPYLLGKRGTPSKVVNDLLVVTGLNREEIFFPDRFDHPDGEDRTQPAYWLNIALEALSEAAKRGADVEHAAHVVREIGGELADFFPTQNHPL